MRKLVSAGMAVLFASAMIFDAGAQTSGYLTDQRGGVVKDPFGLCWRTGFWTPSMATQECDPDLAPKKPAPAKAPAAKPTPPRSAPAKPKPAAKPAAKPTPITEKVTLAADTLFDFDKAVIRADGKAELDKLAARIKGMNVDAIIAIGHTDRIGSTTYNMKLSQRRADAVKAYLVGKGIPANRIHAEGKGEKQPKTKPDQCKGPKSPKVIACLQPDRRVDVEVVGSRTWGPETVQCLQPDRRVLVELSGMTPVAPKPPAKPAAPPKPGAKPAPAPKPPAPEFTQLKANVQGNIAWDPKAAVLKPEGRAELDRLVAQVSKAKTTVTVVVITGHNDVIEAAKNDRSLSEARAKAVADYLVSKGINRNIIFTQGIGSSQPVPVTKFCFPA